MYCAMGTCCFVFVISALLWIILFRILSKGNQFIYDIVYDIPTLGVYHQVYSDFFKKYDHNRDKLFETKSIV